MPRIDDETGNFVGKGEDPTVSLLIHALHLKGIYHGASCRKRHQTYI